MDPTLSNCLSDMTTRLATISATPAADHLADVQAYLGHCFTLDTARRAGLDDADAAVLQDHLAQSAPSIETAWSAFDVDGGEALRVWMQQELTGNDWITICQRRSNIEAFNDLFADHVADDKLIDTEELDDDIRAKAEFEAMPNPDRTPSDLPASHWWWALT
ncbi:hypothetical protein [uncultured Tateyamaria sp.]|uniref:hypothetical protein n=1 Tax=uncultured Tateyamaria sp. TaxID=455651 RepID=UPI0026066827|nr:hypothetical protein [uncultured Tateyamaria sp.]